MPKINVLTSTVYNKIAAGEVVQRPSSVVKELVENSIDAGADRIEISIEGGGIENITVTDNGCGIDCADLAAAFLPHATSKICAEEDLSGIKTLGFRGEALASIAAVSQVALTSKPKLQECAGQIVISGEASELSECAGNDGTRISVSNLFFHTPARLKFLKSARAEEGEIANLISRLILANPNVSFRCTADGRELYHSDGSGIEDALCAVYGFGILADSLPVSFDKNGYRISGYVGRPGFSKPNRTYQTLILNGRYVQNQAVVTAVTNAYGDILMKRQYPFFVLSLEMNPEEVDVNVHPAKAEVRFANNNHVFGTVYRAVFGALRDLNIPSQNSFSEQVFQSEASVSRGTVNLPASEAPVSAGGTVNVCAKTNLSSQNQFAQAESPKTLAAVSTPSAAVREMQGISAEASAGQSRNVSVSTGEEEAYDSAPEAPEHREAAVQTEMRPASDAQDEAAAAEDEDDLEFEIERNEFDMQIYDAWVDIERLRIVGVLFNTYIVVEYLDDFYLVDQHAAHERLLFDRFCNAVVNKSVQSLLIPYVLTLNPQEEEIFISIIPELQRLNFEVESFGVGSYKICGIPLVLTGLNVDAFFRALTSDIKVFKNITDFDVLRDKIAQRACKAAVKAGDTLDVSEIRKLLSYMKKSTLRCPHGRPIIVRYTKTDVEKWFKRIV